MAGVVSAGQVVASASVDTWVRVAVIIIVAAVGAVPSLVAGAEGASLSVGALSMDAADVDVDDGVVHDDLG